MDDPSRPYVLGLANGLRHRIPREASYIRERVKIPGNPRSLYNETGKAACGSLAIRTLVPWEKRSEYETRTIGDCPRCLETERVSPAC